MSDPEEIKKLLTSKKKEKHLPFDRGLSTGSTLLNLACTGLPGVGILPGSYMLFVGESDSGKSWLSLNALAEASINSVFDKYDLIYDGPEGGDNMDKERYFGKKLAARLKPPSPEGASHAIEDFYDNVDEVLSSGKPCVYVLDSMDCLSSEAEDDKFKKQKAARKKIRDTGKGEVPGAMTDGKAKKNSSGLRRLMGPLEETGSILIIINQVRDNIGSPLALKTFSGGNALRFYAQLQVWSSIKERITLTYKEKERHVGNLCRMDVRRSRWTGRKQDVLVPIHFSYGVDDTGSMVDWLLSEGRWEKQKLSIVAPELGLKGTREKLLKDIEDKGLVPELKKVVKKAWDEIIEACSLDRKRRYD